MKDSQLKEQIRITYALSRQMSCINAVDTDYGPIELDEKAKNIVANALRRHYEKRLEKMEVAK